MTVRVARLVVALSLFLAVAVPVLSQSQSPTGRAFTTADYDKATKKLGAALSGLVVGGTANATWLPDERFWYTSTRTAGTEIVLVDPEKGTRAPAFDHARVAAALSEVAGESFTAQTIATASIDLSSAADVVLVTVGTNRWSCDVRGTACGPAPASAVGSARAGGGPGAGLISPTMSRRNSLTL